MHELSVAHSLVELASDAARRAGARAVKEVRLRIGALSCVSPEALDFCYEIATRDTLLEGSKLTYHRVPVVIYCSDCAREVELPGIQRFRCPHCDRPSADLRQGKELEIEALEIEVDDTGPNDTAPNDTGPNDTGPNDTAPIDTAPTGTDPIAASAEPSEFIASGGS